MPTYSEVEYSEVNWVYTRMLCQYLAEHYFHCGSLLDVGAGRGLHVSAFNSLDCISFAFGIDQEPTVPALSVRKCNLEEEKFPFPNDFYDMVFSKSTLEHISNTGHVLAETKRVLKPNGVALFMVPDWNSQWKNFYDDSTHIRPFTKKGLEQAFQLAGFRDIKCEYFYQLPFVWRHSWLKFVPHLIQLIPDKFKFRKNGKHRVLIRFSKEKMLLLTARK